MILLTNVFLNKSVQPVPYLLLPVLLLEMTVLSLQTDGFESFWYSLYTWLHLQM